jgi:hypothetical protein
LPRLPSRFSAARDAYAPTTQVSASAWHSSKASPKHTMASSLSPPGPLAGSASRCNYPPRHRTAQNHPRGRFDPLFTREVVNVRLHPVVCCLHGRPRMEHLWSRAGATSGNWWQMGSPRNGSNRRKSLPPVATSCVRAWMVRRGRRFESIRGLLLKPRKRGAFTSSPRCTWSSVISYGTHSGTPDEKRCGLSSRLTTDERPPTW